MSSAFSVVICTYHRERAGNLDRALASVYEQTLRPDEVVIVLDGDVPAAQHTVIGAWRDRFPDRTVVHALATPAGRGRARNIGVELAQYPWVAIMDSDDVSYPDRFELQMDYIEAHEVDLVAGWQTEFVGDEDNIVATKRCPVEQQALVRSLRFRCLIPNPSIMVRRSAFLDVGGYGDYRHINEDHELFIKLAMSGARFGVIPRPLINVRIDPSQRRRRGWRVLGDDFDFRWGLYRRGYYSLPAYLGYMLLVIGFRLLPVPFKSLLYRKLRYKSHS